MEKFEWYESNVASCIARAAPEIEFCIGLLLSSVHNNLKEKAASTNWQELKKKDGL